KATACQFAARASRWRHVGAAGGARYGICDGPCRSRRGARLRHQNCRRHATRNQKQSRCDPRLSRSRNMSTGTRNLLQLTEAHIDYGKVEAVRGVSLDVAEGEIVTIIGANGAGKTTLLNAIMGILPLRGGGRRRKGAGTFSGGNKQILARGRALRAARNLLMRAEPSLGLAPAIVAD